MNNQLKFRLQENHSFSLVDPNETAKPIIKRKNKKRLVIGTIFFAVAGIVILFLIDGGIGIISASVVEAMKWTHKRVISIPSYVDIPSLITKQ